MLALRYFRHFILLFLPLFFRHYRYQRAIFSPCCSELPLSATPGASPPFCACRRPLFASSFAIAHAILRCFRVAIAVHADIPVADDAAILFFVDISDLPSFPPAPLRDTRPRRAARKHSWRCKRLRDARRVRADEILSPLSLSSAVTFDVSPASLVFYHVYCR